MTTCAVFGSTQAEIAKSYVDLIPPGIVVDDFFAETCTNVSCTSQRDEDSVVYSLRGTWDSVLKAQEVLASYLIKWNARSGDLTSEAPSLEISDSNVEEPPLNDIPDDPSHATETPLNKDSDCNQDCGQLEGSPTTSYSQASRKSSASPESAIEKKIQNLRKRTEESEQKNLSLFLTDCESVNLETLQEGQKRRKQILKSLEDCPTTVDDNESKIENEIYMDIQLEHNYNHNTDITSDMCDSERIESGVENEIYMDIKLSQKPDDSLRLFNDLDLPLTLVADGVEYLHLDAPDALPSTPKATSKTKVRSEVNQEEKQERGKTRKRRYEEDAPFRYFCSLCSFKTKRHSHMRKHSRLHERVCKIYSCNECDFSTIRMSHLQRHVRTHQVLHLSCSECSYRTHNEELLARHQRAKHKKKKEEQEPAKDMFYCTDCNYVSASQKFLERHRSVHTDVKRTKLSYFKCDQCPYQTLSRSNFQRHTSNKHTDERPYLCTTCGLSFKRSDTLESHRKSHAAIRPDVGGLQCSQCQKYYRTEKLLSEHKLTHSEERTYLCEVCGAAFKTQAVQRKHLQEVHFSTKSFPCPTCSKAFKARFLLNRHMNTHIPRLPTAIKPLPGPSSPDDVNEAEQQLTIVDTEEWSANEGSEEVQVLIVKQEQGQELAQSDIVLNEDTYVVHDGSLLQVTPALESGQTLSVPVIPVKYVLPGTNLDQLEVQDCLSASEAQVTSEEEYITLTFV